MTVSDLFEQRRSIYALNKNIGLEKDEVLKIIRQAVLYAPSAFNSQSARVVVLFDQHEDFWRLVLEKLKTVVPAGKFEPIRQKIRSFAEAFGTVLFFEDQKVIDDLRAKFVTYQDMFESWSFQSSGMLQYMVWLAFREKNIGANLQHYNPLIDEAVQEKWNLPPAWKLIAQMPFGGIETLPEPKTFLPIKDRLFVF